MFFEDDPKPITKDPLFDKLAEKNLKYKCKTMKILNMQHAHVIPKEGQGLYKYFVCYCLLIENLFAFGN